MHKNGIKIISHKSKKINKLNIIFTNQVKVEDKVSDKNQQT